MELTPIQKEILTALITLYRQHKRAVKGEEVAEVISRSPGTVRNQMQSLKSLQLVEGVPGPKGGYKPTKDTYKALSITEMEKETVVPLKRNGQEVQNATAAEISFTTLRHPYLCNGIVRVIGDIREFDRGDSLQIGPTPVNKLVMRGEVIGRDDTTNSILFAITEMVSAPKKPVKEYLTTKLVKIPANATIQEASRILSKHNIHGAPVEDKGRIEGIVTLTDIARTLAEGKMTLKIKDIMSKNIISVDGNSPLYEVIKVFADTNVGRLLVRVDGEYAGLITKTDILHKLAVY
ncbi:MAG TPA: CBS domain-containing protein [Candidatus Methanoperedenaceae archaeon]|nr:CBS domain-containing protein [Candidatus Methanoperedenaceae archaeon]